MKKEWYKPPIKGTIASCLCCASAAELLPMETKLYNGFGGWSITKDGQPFFQEIMSIEYNFCRDMNYVETLIGDDTESEYLAELFLPLREATYQRHAKDNWVLIAEGWLRLTPRLQNIDKLKTEMICKSQKQK